MLPGPKGEDRRLYHRSVSRLSKTKVPSLQSVQYHSSTEVLCTCNFRNLHHSPRHLALVTIPSLNNQFGRKTIIRSGATSHMSLIPILFHLRTLSALNNDSRGKRAAPQYQSDELPNRYTSSLQQPSCTLHRIHNRASSCPSIDIRPADAIYIETKAPRVCAAPESYMLCAPPACEEDRLQLVSCQPCPLSFRDIPVL